jgi:GTP-binding protein
LTASEASIVSAVPGTTRDVIEGAFAWKGRDFRLLDTAGVRRKSKVNQDIEYYSVNRAIKAMDDAEIVVLLVDAEEGLADQDKKIAALACEKGRGVVIALNKWDLKPDGPRAIKDAKQMINFRFGQMEWAPIVPLSAKNGLGVAELLNTCVKIHYQLNKKTETSAFNAALAKWQEQSPPPQGPRNRFKIKYGVQTGQNPVAFTVFVSRPEAMSGAYASYIKNRIRADLGYSLIPIELNIKASRQKWANGKPPSREAVPST